MSAFEDDPIEAYLDRVLVTSGGSARQIRHTVDEVHAHLLDSADEARRQGMDEYAARAEAVRRMGPPTGAASRSILGIRLTAALRRRVTLGVLQIAAVAGLAVGVAGVFAIGARAIWGSRVIGDAFPPGSYTSADCRRWLALYPSSHSCLTAMIDDHAADFIRNAGLATVLGILALVAYQVLRRRWADVAVRLALPARTEALIGLASAAVVAIAMTGQGVDAELVTRGQGAGQWFCLAIGAAGAAAWFTRQAHAT